MPCDEYDGVEEYLDEHAAWCVGGSMNRFMKYLNEIGAQYVMNDRTTAESEKIPEPLRGFYNTFQSADLPYGRIYDLDTALRQSGKSPFSPDWFVFGQDNYFSFWLCTKGKADEGLYFTYWDHESGLEIEEPAWEDLLTFLKEVEEDIE